MMQNNNVGPAPHTMPCLRGLSVPRAVTVDNPKRMHSAARSSIRQMDSCSVFIQTSNYSRPISLCDPITFMHDTLLQGDASLFDLITSDIFHLHIVYSIIHPSQSLMPPSLGPEYRVNYW
jgi:hypothetical protein